MTDFILICICVLFMSMAKGGFPIGIVAVPTLVLIWPEQGQAARDVLGFMIPLLCVMDAIGMLFYRKHIQWTDIRPMMLPTVGGVIIGIVVLASEQAVPDKWLQALIGLVGMMYVAWEVVKKLSGKAERHPSQHRRAWPVFCGALSGFSSTVTNFAGPIVSMYLLSIRLDKIRFAAAGVAYFFVLNLMKLPVFSAIGLMDRSSLILGLKTLPVVPLGVFLGWWCVRKIDQRHYIGLIYVVVIYVSVMLLWKAFSMA
jgi:uncharacterized membrane protein YfcA